MGMPFADLGAQQARIRDDLDARIRKVLEHGQYIMGPEVGELEKRLAAFTGARRCVACASGTNALELVLAAWGIGAGDAVFTTPFTFVATAETIARTGAVPIFLDIHPRTFNIGAERLEAAIQAVRQRDRSLHPLPDAAVRGQLAPRALVPVDIFGNAADYDVLLPVAERHNLLVLEDAAQSLGGEWRGRKLGHCGCHAAAVSFFPSKPLGCYGDGGAVLTDDDTLADIVDSLRYHGRVDARHKYENIRLGCNGRLDTIQAAVLLAKLEIFEEERDLRSAVARIYSALLADADGVVLPEETPGARSIWAQYTVLLPDGADRAAVMARMKEDGVPSAIFYPKGLHVQSCFSGLGYAPHDFPRTQEICRRVLSLPMHPYLSREDQEKVAESLKAALRAG